MSEASKTFDRQNSRASPNATFSPALGAGPTPCGLLGGPTTDRSGPVAAPASLSARQAKAAGLLTSGTSGQPGTTSSRSAALASSLGNKLRAAMPWLGGTWFTMTWKQRATPAQRSICALRASALRTSASGSTSWPTASARDWKSSASNLHGVNSRPPNEVARLASWPTPSACSPQNLRGSGTDPEVRKAQGRQVSLQDAVRLATWPTCTVQDSVRGVKDARPWDTGRPLGQVAALSIPGPATNSSPAETASPGQLNPALPRWLMGYLPVWCDCAVTATPSTRTSRPK